MVFAVQPSLIGIVGGLLCTFSLPMVFWIALLYDHGSFRNLSEKWKNYKLGLNSKTSQEEVTANRIQAEYEEYQAYLSRLDQQRLEGRINNREYSLSYKQAERDFNNFLSSYSQRR